MTFISINNLAALVGTSNSVVQKWANNKKFPMIIDHGISGFDMSDLSSIPEVQAMMESKWDLEKDSTPLRQYNSVELFAGAGGLALGMSLAGFHHVLLNEFDTSACNTLKTNKPNWNVIEGDVRHIDFTPLRGKVDFLSGGFPCQAFSYAGKQAGFNDTRGTLFFELARAVKEIRPLVFMGENVKGLISHDEGRTFDTIRNTIKELGYTLVDPRVLKAIMYQVPQKRERLILIAIRNDVADKVQFHWPTPFYRVLTLRDALHKSDIFDTDVSETIGFSYPEKKKQVMALVPQGGNWRDLPEDIAKSYMGGSWLLGGGKTGMARRLSLDEPSLTLTCSPCQKQTERCHPTENRPLSVREYARIQTFPDYWQFQGTVAAQYKQIGNAVPVNLAWAIGRSLIRLLNDIQRVHPLETEDCTSAVSKIMHEYSKCTFIKDNTTQTSIKKDSTKQLNLFSLFELYADNSIVDNSFVHDGAVKYQTSSKLVLPQKNCLVCLVKKDNFKQFENQTAKIYYSGKKFPSTVALDKLFYFMPYLKSKGVRDLYLIKSARVGNRKEGQKDEDLSDFRLVFDIEFVKQVFDDYQPIGLKIWMTFTDTTLNEILPTRTL